MEFLKVFIILLSCVVISSEAIKLFREKNKSTNKSSWDIQNYMIPSTSFTLGETTISISDENSPGKMAVFENDTKTTTENGLIQTKTGLLLTDTTTAIDEKGLLPTETTTVTTTTGLLSTEIGSLTTKTTTVPTDMVSLAVKIAYNRSEIDNATSNVNKIFVPTSRHSSQQTRLQAAPTTDYFLCSDYSLKSCSGICGQAPEVGCACDELCVVYNSCCDDYQDVCSTEANLASIKFQRLLNLKITCEQVLYQATTGAQVISSCPSDYTSDPEIKQQCENGNILFIPVTSRNLELHFRSVYCMLCNGGQLSGGLFWTIAAAVYGRITTMFETQNEFTQSVRGRTYFVPIHTQDVPLRHCFVEAASSSCHENSLDLGDTCFASKENLVSLKIGSTHNVFKNIHCLKCSARNQSSLDQLYCKHTQMFDLKILKAPKFQFLLDWKTPVSFVVTHRLKYVWKEMECHLNEPGVDNLQPFCQITKCNKNTVLKNNTCDEGNTFSCFLYQFRLHLNLSEHFNDLELVNKSLALFQFKLANTLYQTYSKNTSTLLKESGVSWISVNLELDEVTAHIWVKLHGPPSLSYLKGKLNAEYFEFLNTTLIDVRMNFSLCACPAYLRYDEYCQVKKFCSEEIIYICLGGSRGDDRLFGITNHYSSGTYHTDMSHYLIGFMFGFKYIRF